MSIKVCFNGPFSFFNSVFQNNWNSLLVLYGSYIHLISTSSFFVTRSHSFDYPKLRKKKSFSKLLYTIKYDFLP